MSLLSSPVFGVGADHAAGLRARLAHPDSLLVACLCAAWCDSCRQYAPRFAELAATRPQHAFTWIDIESSPELLGDEDVENFPTLLVQSAQRVLFFGPMLPHIGHLEKLLDRLADPRQAVMADAPGPGLPDVRALLQAA